MSKSKATTWKLNVLQVKSGGPRCFTCRHFMEIDAEHSGGSTPNVGLCTLRCECPDAASNCKFPAEAQMIEYPKVWGRASCGSHSLIQSQIFASGQFSQANKVGELAHSLLKSAKSILAEMERASSDIAKRTKAEATASIDEATKKQLTAVQSSLSTVTRALAELRSEVRTNDNSDLREALETTLEHLRKVESSYWQLQGAEWR